MNSAQSPEPRATGYSRWLAFRPELDTGTLILLASVFFTVFCNTSFWQAAITHGASQWRLAIGLFLFVTGTQAFLLGLLVWRWSAKPLLTLLFVVTAFAAHFMSAYGIYLDPDMIRNVLHTDQKESRELINPKLIVPLLLYALVPVVLLWRVRLRKRPPMQALLRRLGFLVAVLLVAGVGVMASFQDLSALMRNNKAVRYLITPSNYVISLARVGLATPPGPKAPLLPIGEDARQAARPAGSKPRLIVFVLGETARAANWGLDGYARQTTPQLAAMPDVINFPQVRSCGTSTEVSVPCLFSPWGRHDYNEKTIRSHQSLLHVLNRAGVATLWRDNQSGCKGVCEGLPFESLDNAKDAELCGTQEGRCYDEILIKGLQARLDEEAKDGKDRIVVLHQLGNHGPAYYLRYPAAFKRFTPTCDTEDLGQCDPAHIVNAYDNALLYTDHLLADTIGMLKAQSGYDAAMIYVSDHGESLGEKGLFLHGVPYAIAPSEQTHVPMATWFSPGFAQSHGLDLACVRQRARQPASHDNLFPSILGLLQVQTKVYDRRRDLFAGCEATH
ncbi:MAG TPA: phosphoethanolamine transferase [Xanthomonadaceae bacterium]|nr:phosphoethanolamine transferase [Xanthomonadaceae bacterium]